MDGSFIVQLFDLLVYLLPGLMSLLGVYLILRRKFPDMMAHADSKLVIIYFVVFSFVAGLLLQVLATSLNGAYRWLANEDFILNNVRSFEGLERVREIVSEKTKIKLTSDGSTYRDDLIYRYAEVYVYEKAPNSSVSISRLMALSIFCRNSTIPVVILAVGVFLNIKRKKKWYVWAVLLLSIVLIEILLARGMIAYRAAAVRMTLRAFLLFQ